MYGRSSEISNSKWPDALREVLKLALLHRNAGRRVRHRLPVSSSQDTSGLAAMLRTTNGKYAGRGPKCGTTSRMEGEVSTLHRNGRLGLVGSRPETLCWQLADSGLYVIRYDNRDTGISSQPYTAVELAEDAVGSTSFQRNAMPQSPRPNSCWLDEPITGEQAMICLRGPTRDRPLGQPVRAGDRRRGRPRDVYPAPFAHLMIGQRQALRAAYAALLKERVAVHLCPGMVGQLPCWSGHIAATAAMSYRVMPMCGRCVTSGCAPRRRTRAPSSLRPC